MKVFLQLTCPGCSWRGHPGGSSFTLVRECCKPGSLPSILRIYWIIQPRFHTSGLKQASLLRSGGIWSHTGPPWLPASHVCSVRGAGEQLIQPCAGLGSPRKAVIQVQGRPHRLGGYESFRLDTYVPPYFEGYEFVFYYWH